LNATLGGIVIWSEIFSVIAGTMVGKRKGTPVGGFVLGLVLSWVGVIIVACVRPSREELVRREVERQSIKAEARRHVEGTD
jgi:hypothetical protein